MKSPLLLFLRLLLLLCCVPNFSLASGFIPDSLLHKTFTQRAPLTSKIYQEQVKYEDSATWFLRTDAIEKIARKNEDHDLEIEAEIMRLYYYVNRLPYNTEACTQRMGQLRKTALAEKNDLLLARIESINANYCWGYMHNYELAFEHYLAQYEVMKRLTDEEYPDKQPSLYTIGEHYYYFNDYQEAIFFLKNSLQVKLSTGVWPYLTLQANNTIGLCYRKIKQLDSSDHYFNRTYQYALATNNEAWQGIASGNLGHNLFLRGKYKEAIPLLEKDVLLSVQRNDWACAAGAQTTLATIYIMSNNLPKATEMIMQALNWTYQSSQYDRLESVLPIVSKVYALQGKPALAILYMDSALSVKDSIARKYNALQLVRARQKNDLQIHRAQILQIEDEKRIKTLQRNALLTALLILFAIAIYIYILQRSRYRQRQQLLDMQLHEKEQQLKMAELQLSDFARSISEKSRLVEELQTKIDGSVNQSILAELQQKTILTDEEWEHFRQLFEQVHAGFLQRLRDKLPGLTPAETRFMVLAKLQFNTKEMASILGVSPQAIRTIWYRLRKKINLPEEGSVEELVENI